MRETLVSFIFCSNLRSSSCFLRAITSLSKSMKLSFSLTGLTLNLFISSIISFLIFSIPSFFLISSMIWLNCSSSSSIYFWSALNGFPFLIGSPPNSNISDLSLKINFFWVYDHVNIQLRYMLN